MDEAYIEQTAAVPCVPRRPPHELLCADMPTPLEQLPVWTMAQLEAWKGKLAPAVSAAGGSGDGASCSKGGSGGEGNAGGSGGEDSGGASGGAVMYFAVGEKVIEAEAPGVQPGDEEKPLEQLHPHLHIMLKFLSGQDCAFSMCMNLVRGGGEKSAALQPACAWGSG